MSNFFVRTAAALPKKPKHPDNHPDPSLAGKAVKAGTPEYEAWKQQHAAVSAQNAAYLQANPAHPQNLVDMYNNKVNDDEKSQGAAWYPSANHTAHAIAKSATEKTGRPITADQVAGLMAIYSPQMKWPDNIHLASMAAHGIFPGENGGGWRSPHDGKGFLVTGEQAKQARRIYAGEDWRNVASDIKTGNFGQNISTGGRGRPAKMADGSEVENRQARGDRPNITVDRHAISSIHGGFVDDDTYKATGVSTPKIYDQYVDHFNAATDMINKQHGTNLSPADLQATVWLPQQRLNEEGGYADPQDGARVKASSAASLNRLAGYAAINHDPDFMNHIPGTGFTGGGGNADSAALNVSQTYHGMPTHDGQQMATTMAPPVAPTKHQQLVQTKDAAGKPGKGLDYKGVNDDGSLAGQPIHTYSPSLESHIPQQPQMPQQAVASRFIRRTMRNPYFVRKIK